MDCEAWISKIQISKVGLQQFFLSVQLSCCLSNFYFQPLVGHISSSECEDIFQLISTSENSNEKPLDHKTITTQFPRQLIANAFYFDFFFAITQSSMHKKSFGLEMPVDRVFL